MEASLKHLEGMCLVVMSIYFIVASIVLVYTAFKLLL